VLGRFAPQQPVLNRTTTGFAWNHGEEPALLSQPIVALEKIMPRTIQIQQFAERTVVTVLAIAICLIVIFAVMDMPLKLVLP